MRDRLPVPSDLFCQGNNVLSIKYIFSSLNKYDNEKRCFLLAVTMESDRGSKKLAG